MMKNNGPLPAVHQVEGALDPLQFAQQEHLRVNAAVSYVLLQVFSHLAALVHIYRLCSWTSLVPAAGQA